MAKPDDRSDNVKKIQTHIDATIQNMEMADELLAKTDDPQTKRDLAQKNERRRDALGGMRLEIKDEAAYQKNKSGDSTKL